MGDHVHFVPVGFDFDRLIQPITQKGLDADKIYLLNSVEGVGEETAERLVESMVDELDRILANFLGYSVDKIIVEDIFDYSSVFEFAYNKIRNELEKGNHVYVNISSMPRTVAFAFATAASSLIIEMPQYRNSVLVYYVPADEYLVLDLLDELDDEIEFLNRHEASFPDSEHQDRLESLRHLRDEIWEHGIARVSTSSPAQVVEIPAPPMADLSPFQMRVLLYLNVVGKSPSITRFANQMAGTQGSSGDTFNSRIQYNVDKLIEKGYIKGTEEGRGTTIELSRMGELWALTHNEEDIEESE